MLGRLLRTAFRPRSRIDAAVPTEMQNRLAAEIRAAADASDHAKVQSLLDALARTAPRCARLHRAIGSHLGRLGMLEFARAQLETALEIDPSHDGTWIDLGNVHRLSERIGDAAECYRRALQMDPENEAAHLGMAAIDARTGRDDAALDRLNALVRRSASPSALETLVELLDRRSRTDEAKQACIGVLSRVPEHGIAHAALGFLLLKREYRPQEALACFDRAVAAGHADASLWSNRGIALQDLGRVSEALASYEQALAMESGHALARFHRSLVRLMQHDFDHAWPDYELRLASADRQPPPCDLPAWDGASTDEGVLVYGEQGIGDEIMFASCLPDLLRSCPHVTLACTPKLVGLFARSFPAVDVIELARAAASPCNPEWKQTVAIGSLPKHFRRSRAAFPSHRGYLKAEPSLVAEYRDRLAALGPGLKVGLSWRGGTDKTRRALRSIDLASLSPLFELCGVRFVNLQYDSHADDETLQPLIDSGQLTHWQDALDDYEHTAALVASLDVVVSVCTAVIHLAGALNRPTVVMAALSPEWRYGITGSDMPWYPCVHVERQRVAREWGDVVVAVCERVASFRDMKSLEGMAANTRRGSACS